MNALQFKKQYSLLFLLSLFYSFTLNAQGWNPERLKESKEALNKIIEDSPKLQLFKDKAYGYTVFPRVTKAGIGIGGAAGRGIVFRNHNDVGWASLKQASIGFQLGGKQYSEVIFFENKKAYDHFINGKLKFDAQASAVAITAGDSIDAAYHNGLAVVYKNKRRFNVSTSFNWRSAF